MTDAADKLITDTSTGTLLSRKSYRVASWACLLAATCCMIATLSAIVIVRAGALGDFSPLGVLRFVAHNLTWWRLTLFAASAASLAYLFLVVALRDIVEPKLRSLALLCVCFCTIASTNALNAYFSMLVLFTDLSLQLSMRGGFPHAELSRLAWVTMNQSVMQTMLIANSLYAVVGLFLVSFIFRSRHLPNWLAWSGLPIALVALNVSIFTFIGELQWAMVLSFAGLIALVLWLTTLGLVLRMMARQA